MKPPRITGVTITPVAVLDPPLLNASGVHQPYQLRAVIELHTDAGITGLGEAYGDDPTLANLRAAAPVLEGLSVFDLNGLTARTATALGAAAPGSPTDLIGAASREKTIAQTVGALEVAFYDAQGKATGLRVCDVLGGAVREAVPYSAYLFYRWARHPQGATGPDYPDDDFGEALDPAGIVAQAKRLVDVYGFGSLKLKGGVFAPEEEAEAIAALHEAFPGRPLRLDPNANWSVETSLRVTPRLEGLLEYLEDPTGGNPGMARVAAGTSLPLATNMCVTSFAEIPEAVRLGSVSIVLSDHHYWGGMRASQRLAGLCATFGWGLSMHSNTHLGISLAAMTHLAAALPELTYACDTHSVWQREDVVRPGALVWSEGSLAVPAGPGLGVELDREALARLHQQYLDCGIRSRDDVSAMRLADPSWERRKPRF
ncbi:enolase C-terminal domain-like protein [Streptomyces sp. SL13]|uniref:glucarate dehydratase n=1 Tax=Streptantibioticus silvisoli TaxID=2705255 RepID=A0AA90H9Q6_9ACTN|nr:enolase C-terminal domain-like protein [Streptantibioticus silvisoli]MDI5963790.1 enolase C-terminal domain-like protein [Streptantibioticus silvisoli]MDI5972827.1 enolase C-terminal domain-like protein [Streptantibioticus silvisoli]